MVYTRNSILNFGKHKGKTIQNIFTGRSELTDKEVYELTGIAAAQLVEKKSTFGNTFKFYSKTEISIFSAQIGIEDDDIYSNLIMNLNGFPDYISWCMTSHDNFYLEESEIEFLESLDVFDLKSIYIRECNYIEKDNGYSINADQPIFATSKYTFNQNAKEKNREKKFLKRFDY